MNYRQHIERASLHLRNLHSLEHMLMGLLPQLEAGNVAAGLSVVTLDQLFQEELKSGRDIADAVGAEDLVMSGAIREALEEVLILFQTARERAAIALVVGRDARAKYVTVRERIGQSEPPQAALN